MADRIFGTIETQINDGLSLTSINTSGQSITTYQQGAPQIQTVIENGVLPLASVINAPFVEVTSVNGMTGDVTVDAQINAFKPNYYYLKDSAVTYNGKLYFAKQTFTSGSSFNANDWDMPDFAQEQADWNENDSTAKSYIKNKPTIPTVNNGTLTIQKNGTTVDTFTANSATNKTANITVPTDTRDLTNNAGYLKATDVYPVGSIVTFYDTADHSNFLGLTWTRFAAGRMIVGYDSSDTDFDTIGEAGGEKTHTLTVDEIPSHRHLIGQTYSGYRVYEGGSAPNAIYTGYAVAEPTNYVGGGQAHNNMPPYITAALWRRTA